jgi:hypothetical protein
VGKKNQLGNLGVDGNIILEFILNILSRCRLGLCGLGYGTVVALADTVMAIRFPYREFNSPYIYIYIYIYIPTTEL